MNSKVLVTIIIIVSATLGLYLGANQVTSQKENIKDTHSDGLYTPSGDVSNDNNISNVDFSGDGDNTVPSGEQQPTATATPTPVPTDTVNSNRLAMPENFKATYMTGWGAGTKSIRESVIKTMKEYGFNAIVLDIKDEGGQLSYNSKVQTAIDIGSSRNMIRDIDAVLKEFHDNGIYVVGRIVTFKDPIYAGSVKTTVAYKKADGTTWKDYSGKAWPNPYNENSWEYPIALAKEAAELGFDEIQFDYIRFPSSEGKVKEIAYGFNSATASKADTICAYLTKVMQELAPYNIPISADVFGITTKRDGDFENIGQDFARISGIVDVVCPMVYPSHYANNEYKIAKPDLAPYDTIYRALQDAQKRLLVYSGDSNAKVASIRPYLQDFTASWLGKGNYQTYGTDQVAKQIQATYDLGLKDFTLWDPSNKYCYDAITKVTMKTEE